MRNFTLRVLLVLLFSCGLWALAACGIVMQMVGLDPDPPEGYRPRYIKNVKPFAPPNLHDVALEISRIEPISASRLKIYTHLIDTNGAYLTGAAAEKYRKIWCEIIDSSEYERRSIASFRLREYNKTDRKPQAIALVMDFSGSMGEERANAVQEAAHNFISQIKQPEDAVALIKYDHIANVECPLTTDKNELLHRLHSKQGLQGYGGHTATFTAVAKGIKEAMNSGDDKQRVVIVFTDGDDNASWLTKEDVIRFARETNTIVCAIDYGYAIGDRVMEDIARKTYGTYNHIYRRAEFDLVFKDIYRRFEDYYLIEFDQTDFGAHFLYLKLCPPQTPQKPIEAKSSYDNTPYPGSVSLLNVFFDSDKFTIKPQSENAIRQLVQLLRNDSTMQIEIRGHTDSQNSTKDPDYNVKLSQRRADAIRDELIRRGIKGDRIVAQGLGEKQPVADNATPEGRAKNRRTEFVIVAPSHIEYVNQKLALPPRPTEQYPVQPINYRTR